MRMKIGLLSIFLIVISIVISGCASTGANLGAVKTLIKLGQNDKLKQKAQQEETRNFQRLKAYIQTSKIKAGVSAKYALSKFGTPVIDFREEEGQRWVYKAASANWFGGEKIYLVFDKENKLASWECVDCK